MNSTGCYYDGDSKLGHELVVVADNTEKLVMDSIKGVKNTHDNE